VAVREAAGLQRPDHRRCYFSGQDVGSHGGDRSHALNKEMVYRQAGPAARKELMVSVEAGQQPINRPCSTSLAWPVQPPSQRRGTAPQAKGGFQKGGSPTVGVLGA
jgi:hypothetical protein